jgi:hypothetical protein
MFCPSCGKNVSEQAKSCPNCGHPFSGGSSPNSKMVVLLLCLFLPTIHRFYVGKIGTGILFFLTGFGFGIWWIIDLINICRGEFTDKDGLKVDK